MARKKWVAIVIGAGPAGASAARTLVAGGLDCLLIEKKKLPRHKMCLSGACHTPTIMVFSDPPLPRTPDKLVLRSP